MPPGSSPPIRRLGLATLSLVVLALLATASSAVGAAPLGTGKTVSFAFSRSGSAGVVAGACGTRLQCFKAAIVEASAATAPIVERAALAMINVDLPDQDVNMALSGKQLLIAPDADPNLNGTADFAEATNKISLGGGTCFTCALQAAQRSFVGARPDSAKVIVLVSERVNTFASTGFTSHGVPTGYPPMTIQQMAGQFDANTVVRAFAVGPAVTCASDPNGFGSLNDAAAATPGGTCTEVPSFDGLGAVITAAVTGGGGPPPPDTTAPVVTLSSPLAGSSTSQVTPSVAGAAGAQPGDESTVTVKLWQGSDVSAAPLQTLVATAAAGAYSIQAPTLAEGSYTVQAEQRDAAGNVGRSPAVGFTVALPVAGPQAYANSVRADTPRAYWRLGEATGLVAAEDRAAATGILRLNGTYVGGVALGVAGATHDLDTAARFDGGNDRVGVADDDLLDFGTEDFTVESWIKPTASDERVVIAKRSVVATEAYWSITVTDDPNHNGQIRAIYFDGTNARTAYSAKGTVDGAWHHVVVGFDRDVGITISVDGVTKTTALALAPSVSNTGELWIGKGPNNPYFKGDLDEVALYAGLLPVERIQAHAAAAAA